MEDLKFWLILWIAMPGILVQGVTATSPTVHCSSNGMTPEGSLLNCTCGVQGSTNSQFFWPGYSSGPNLLVPNVRRAQNGTIYTCLKQTPGMNNETTLYTLQVAYGPSDNDTVLEGPPSFTTDGTKDLTLTCTAKNVNPTPLYGWPNKPNCMKTTKCTFKPELKDNGSLVFCTATSGVLETSGTGTYKINLAAEVSTALAHIVGPTGFIIDGTKSLTLTCMVTGADKTILYNWPSSNCTSGTNTCTFVPRIEDDGSQLLCTATNIHTGTTLTASYRLDLNYPPTTPPVISRGSATDVMSAGDSLTCTVSGGKPLVSSVNFRCIHPIIDGGASVKNTNSVSSSLVVSTSNATNIPMNCACSAEWSPQPDMYSLRAVGKFLLEFKAKVTSFTVNNRTELTVREEDKPPIAFICIADAGRPSAQLTLRNAGNNTSFPPSQSTNNTQAGNHITTVAYSLQAARCEDTGTYLCVADNTFPDPDVATVLLNVTCGPRNYNTSQGADSPPELTSAGLKVFLIANPVPLTFEYSYRGNATAQGDGRGLDGLFTTACVREKAVDQLVVCSILPDKVSEEFLGTYNLTISNGLGQLIFVFEVNQTVGLAQGSKGGLSFTTLLTIAGGGAGALLLIVLVVTTVICVRRKRQRRGETKDGDEELGSPGTGTPDQGGVRPATNTDGRVMCGEGDSPHHSNQLYCVLSSPNQDELAFYSTLAMQPK
ncbi:hemicentin-1-like isoform X2 [Littorina saxatilis]|uniref:hemicentin-1-like isoform X2 n=1 Tax=Littorina saxatilis TaxID=31220 RepID=UPI0038B5C989